jgi:hypothetical protein
MTEIDDKNGTAHARADNHSQATAVSVGSPYPSWASIVAAIAMGVLLAAIFTTAAYGGFHGN